VLVGDGPDRQALEAAAPPAVRFAGQSNDVAKWYAAATVVVIPSRWEGLSLVVIEAMARGRSVVASDVAGMSQALEGGAGALVAPEAPAPLADALADRLADPALADAEGVAGRARVEQRFDLRVTAERIAELYADTLARRSS
jgi:glycosyltransferase involved in cell wall biosynthesis